MVPPRRPRQKQPRSRRRFGEDPTRARHEKLKAYASRELNHQFGKKAPRWTRHGSTAWIWRAEKVDSAVDYVVQRQGAPMAVYENQNRWQEFMDW
ncbi:MAG TPA: hypothetical protein VML01_10110 [Bryobacterales bacterium]|nr:hypothetical protein [Bryobacterales bacterium]